jgi:hypothetical protein
MKNLKITINGEQIRAKLMYETAPELVDVFVKHLPIEGKANHAKICDNEFFIQAPFFKDEKENPIPPVPGDIGFFPVRQTICLWYDETEPLGPSTIIAKVFPEDLSKCAAVASKIWKEQGATIKYELLEG